MGGDFKIEGSVMDDKASVLIVDDNGSLCETMTMVLENEGYQVVTAETGVVAIEAVQDRPFDIIFMDVRMPLMDGVETYRRIKKVRPGAAVVMMTAYAVEDLINEALQEGARGVLYKPFEIEKMVDVIEQARRDSSGALIMVVDDDPEVCDNFKNTLVTSGYRIGIARSGDEAIALAREMTYDVIFIDIKLPAINGLQTYLAIKEINPKVVAVMMTAYRQETVELVEAALEQGAYTCLYKPLDMQEVLRLVSEICVRTKQ